MATHTPSDTQHFLPTRLDGLLRGCLAIMAIVTNTLFWGFWLLLGALAKWMSPPGVLHQKAGAWVHACANGWVTTNQHWIRGLHDTAWNLHTETEHKDTPLPKLEQQGWYFIISNHQSWVDILVLQQCLGGKIPLLKFFIKQELIWIPVLGLAWWALDFPFMKRYSASYLNQHPDKRGKDLATALKACRKFRTLPTSITNFVEGTRFSEHKHRQQSSPYRYLLKPRAGGLALALAAMEFRHKHLLDVTIHYPSGAPTFWQFLQGKLVACNIEIRHREIPSCLLGGDYQSDSQYRDSFKRWVEGIWLEKDERLAQFSDDADRPWFRKTAETP
jgi:hypothetical protein